MKRYLVTADSIIDGQFVRRGTELRMSDDFVPTDHMDALPDLVEAVEPVAEPEPAVEPEPEPEPDAEGDEAESPEAPQE